LLLRLGPLPHWHRASRGKFVLIENKVPEPSWSFFIFFLILFFFSFYFCLVLF